MIVAKMPQLPKRHTAFLHTCHADLALARPAAAVLVFEHWKTEDQMFSITINLPNDREANDVAYSGTNIETAFDAAKYDYPEWESMVIVVSNPAKAMGKA